MARLDALITNIVDLYLEYAGEQGRLSRDVFKSMLEAETQSPEIRAKVNPEDIDSAMKVVDKNRDDEVNFREFCRCVNVLARSHYQKRTGKTGKGGKGKGGKGGKGGRAARAARKAQGEEDDDDEEEEEEEGEEEEEPAAE